MQLTQIYLFPSGSSEIALTITSGSSEGVHGNAKYFVGAV